MQSPAMDVSERMGNPSDFRPAVEILGLPRKQKIGVKNIWVQKKRKFERNADNFGCEFWAGGGAETLEKQGRKVRGKSSLKKFAEKFADNFLKFARQPREKT